MHSISVPVADSFQETKSKTDPEYTPLYKYFISKSAFYMIYII